MVGTEKTLWEFSPGWLSPATLRAAGTSDNAGCSSLEAVGGVKITSPGLTSDSLG